MRFLDGVTPMIIACNEIPHIERTLARDPRIAGCASPARTPR
jgi:hypothetical protein